MGIGTRITNFIDPAGNMWLRLLCCVWVIDCCGLIRPPRPDFSGIDSDTYETLEDEDGVLHVVIKEEYIQRRMRSNVYVQRHRRP